MCYHRNRTTDSIHLSVPGCAKALHDDYVPKGKAAWMQQEAASQGVYDKLCMSVEKQFN